MRKKNFRKLNFKSNKHSPTIHITNTDDSSDEELLSHLELVSVKDSNLLNATLRNTYQQNQKKAEKPLVQPSQPEQTKKRKSQSEHASSSKKRKPYIKERPSERLKDLAGLDNVIDDIIKLVVRPFRFPEIYKELGVIPHRGLLLVGSPGTGKTMLANAIAGELGVTFLSISAPELVSGLSGQSEHKIRNLFKEAQENAPAIIFIDEIDAIVGQRDNSDKDMEVRIVAQLLSCMDDLKNSMVFVIGATNRPSSLDDALRRAGRFDREILLGMPDVNAREQILKTLSAKIRLKNDVDFRKLAKMTAGYVGADIKALITEATTIATNRIFDQMDDSQTMTDEELLSLNITMSDFEQAVQKIQPSAMREGFATKPDVTWDDIGALHSIRNELQMSIVEPIKNSEKFEKLGITKPSGVLLYGPPGCGKTLLAKAVSRECGANFISVKGPELLNKYVGESEKALRVMFQRARASSPCIIFFDELDSLCPRRDADSSNATERIVNQLLTELDGVEDRKMVFVIAATNRLDILDPAILRPGRLDKSIYVPLPSPKERVEILKTASRKSPLDKDVNLEAIALSKLCDGFSGADLTALVREAAICCYKEISQNKLDENAKLKMRHFEKALEKVKPSAVSKSDIEFYTQMRDNQ